MGQSLSGESDTDGLSEEVFRHARHVSELAALSYEEFLDYLKQLNELLVPYQIVFAISTILFFSALITYFLALLFLLVIC